MIYVNNCGHDSHHPKPCDIEHQRGVPDYLILLIKKESWIILERKKLIIQPNSLICFPPDTYIHYGCDMAGYNDDWIHFLPDRNEQETFLSLHLPMCQIVRPHDFHKLSEYVRMLSDCFYSNYQHKDEMINSFMHIFLYALQEELRADSDHPLTQKYYQDLSGLRTQIYNNPANSWNVPDIASSLCLSLSYFQHLYKHFFKCSCQQDIINARLALAKYYLANSSMSIHNLADYCGYNNELHFMRQFKKFIGMTPTEYRRHYYIEM